VDGIRGTVPPDSARKARFPPFLMDSGVSNMNYEELSKSIEDVKSRSLTDGEALASVATVLSAFVSDPANQPRSLPAMTCGLYTRILLSSLESNFQIVVVFWGPHSKSPIHDHSATVGAVACLKGVTEETKYQVVRTEGSKACLKALDTLRLAEGVVTPILPDDERQLHDMVNSTSEWAATIHVYLTPIHYFHIYEPLPDGSFRMHPTELWFDEHGASHLWTRGDRAHA
jgi:predicted metal-dependent enzyme (double-stranded beta helix superfamily)